MRKRTVRRVLSLVLAFVLCVTVLPAGKTEAEAAFDIDALLNSVELHPQRTGYAALDRLLENVLKPYENATTAEKVRACFDWTVRNIDYSWAGYTSANSGYDGFKEKYPYDDYEEGLQKAFPEDVIARTYYTMSKHKGVCYDWGAVFAVMVRYIGIDAFVHTGIFRFEWDTQSGHHGWTEVQINGTNYIFDPQREYRMCDDGTGTISHTRYYGLRYSDTDRYTQETEINAKRDAQFLSVSAHRQKLVSVGAYVSRSGSVTGADTYDVGTTATLTAVPDEGKSFQGWYSTDGTLLSTETAYSFEVTGKTMLIAMFEGDLFYDLKEDDWFLDNAINAANMGIVSGTRPFYFEGNGTMSRAMTVVMLAKLDGADLSGYTSTSFSDVPEGQWYTAAVAWASENGIVSGTGTDTFSPDANITREQFATIIASYLNWKQVLLAPVELTFTDTADISDYAVEPIGKLYGAGLLSGYSDGTIRPKNNVTRAEGVTILMAADRFLREVQEMEPQEITDWAA
ncbi:MAG TPA: S-layer homology domain-containing protein [Candidatus Butyricicoccus stercorigallinarum]|nr:S-layer homology domain-containing protein [Candidatus Butyricicoccus stercorigallinarum]